MYADNIIVSKIPSFNRSLTLFYIVVDDVENLSTRRLKATTWNVLVMAQYVFNSFITEDVYITVTCKQLVANRDIGYRLQVCIRSSVFPSEEPMTKSSVWAAGMVRHGCAEREPESIHDDTFGQTQSIGSRSTETLKDITFCESHTEAFVQGDEVSFFYGLTREQAVAEVRICRCAHESLFTC